MSSTAVSPFADLIAVWQQITPAPDSLERMHKACQSLSATLAGIDSGSLFDTEPALLQTTLDELNINNADTKNHPGADA
jgi:hypothetical protein